MKQQLKVALVTVDPTSKKVKVDYLVISFARSDDLKHFEKIWDEAVENLKKQTEIKEQQK